MKPKNYQVYGTLKERRELSETRKELVKVKRQFACVEKEHKLMSIERNHLLGLVEVFTFSVLSAKTNEELDKSKTEYREFRRKSEINMQKKMFSIV